MSRFDTTEPTDGPRDSGDAAAGTRWCAERSAEMWSLADGTARAAGLGDGGTAQRRAHHARERVVRDVVGDAPRRTPTAADAFGRWPTRSPRQRRTLWRLGDDRAPPR